MEKSFNKSMYSLAKTIENKKLNIVFFCRSLFTSAHFSCLPVLYLSVHQQLVSMF